MGGQTGNGEPGGLRFFDDPPGRRLVTWSRMSQMPREVVCPLLPCDVAGAGKPQKLLENVVRVQLPLTPQAREQRGHPVPLDFKVFLDLHFFGRSFPSQRSDT